MTAFFRESASVKSCMLTGIDSAVVSSVRYLKFDNISSSNDYQFTLSHAAGASFLLTGSTSIKESGTTGQCTFQWYDETNSTYIGFKGSLYSATLNTGQFRYKNPYYRPAATALIKASDFGGADITVSLRVVSDVGSPNYAFGASGFETWSGYPCLQVFQSA
jgi:hypothetical protein